jgi:hypothetical protein
MIRETIEAMIVGAIISAPFIIETLKEFTK